MIKLKINKIQNLIAASGYSVKAWGQKYGFPQTTLSNWLTGSRNIKRSSLDALASALGVAPEDIAEFVWVYTGDGIPEIEEDKDEIANIFENLTKKQRKTIIEFARLAADANRKADLAEFGITE